MEQNNPTPGSRRKAHNWRWILGLFFFFCGLYNSSDYDISIDLFFVALGIGFIAWFFVPIIKDAKQKAAENARKEAAIQQAQDKEDLRVHYCKSCGAWSRGSVCEYCGSSLED